MMNLALFKGLYGLAALACWLASLFLPALQIDHQSWMKGWLILASGFIGVIALQFGWFANLLYAAEALAGLFNLHFKGAFTIRLVMGVVAILLALQVTVWRLMAGDDGEHTITALGLGFYLWLGSGVILLLGLVGEQVLKGPGAP